MAAKRRFDVGDEVLIRGTVRLVDAAGPGSVTIELGTGLRVNMSELSASIELVAKAKPPPSPKGRPKPLL